ncbi:DNA-binding NarL/FixJ family response regulator [Umezawaea tangerina]|uniref:DNA-binding NarL/FixJ family response regulator n=2 Tax=Umezawaea tangerina TaxID=84725 RepID=A0A2T0SZZ3_9PSEU|nr:DNA-binding NarL/FixJ family response regulator [Umezawaea tangerina]
MASGLHAMLRTTPGITIVSAEQQPEVTIAVADDSSLLDLLSTFTTSRLVLIADELRQAELWTAIEHGLVVLVPRAQAATRSRLLQAISDARGGRGDLPPELLGAVLRGLKQLHETTLGPRELTLSGLSLRETQIVRLLADGLDTAEIAEQLIYSERTVKNVLHNLLTRLDLHNRAHAVAYALRHGLI